MLDTGEKNGRPTGISLVETYDSVVAAVGHDLGYLFEAVGSFWEWMNFCVIQWTCGFLTNTKMNIYMYVFKQQKWEFKPPDECKEMV